MPIMHLKYTKLFTFFIIVINTILVYYTWKLFLSNSNDLRAQDTSVSDEKRQKDRVQTLNKHVKKAITIIFRDFYNFENDLQHSIENILNLIPNVQILVIYDVEPYPPLNFIRNLTATRTNVKFINLSFDIHKSAKALSPIFQIKTKYVLFMPDSIRLGSRTIIQKILKEMEKETQAIAGKFISSGNVNRVESTDVKSNLITAATSSSNSKNNNIDSINKQSTRKILIIPFASNVKTMANCCSIKLDFSNWTMQYSVKNGTTHCDMFLQKHAILVDTPFLKTMPNALLGPFPEMFYIQAKVGKSKQIFSSLNLQDGKRLFTAYHTKQRKKEIRRQQFKEMYKKLNIKKVVRKFAGKSAAKIEKFRRQREGKIQNGAHIIHEESKVVLSNTTLPLITTIEYYGCEKNTRSCIGPVYNRKPFFIYLNKNTPPCCIEKLKSVFNHVLEEFENVGIRYWLDNYVLKSAVEQNQLANDAYEIDVSFNAFDLERSSFLKKAQTRPLGDASGYYWIKATDGHYFRVQYSKQNQIGVNLLPFEIIGERVVPSGFYGWKAKEFSIEFLHPMSTVAFLNKNVMCPNNVREFLEHKSIN